MSRGRYQGELFGHGDELAREYFALGLDKGAIRYADDQHFLLT